MYKKFFPIAILASSILYIFVIPANPEPLKIFFKLIPMWIIICMAIFQYKQVPQKTHFFILIGLIFGMLGDGLLHWFTIGLSAFLIGHFFYIIGFLQQWTFSKWRLLTIFPIFACLLIIGSQIVNGLNTNDNKDLIIPIMIYILVIGTMGWLAVMTGKKLITIGALLFLVSDSLLAWNKFVSSLEQMSFLIMVTYYAAQYYIARSIQNSAPLFFTKRNLSREGKRI